MSETFVEFRPGTKLEINSELVGHIKSLTISTEEIEEPIDNDGYVKYRNGKTEVKIDVDYFVDY